MNQTIADYIRALECKNPATAECYGRSLNQFEGWLKKVGTDVVNVTLDDLHAYQKWLAEEYRSPDGRWLRKSTQSTRLAAVKALYKWMTRRGIILTDVCRPLRLPKTRRRTTQRDYLTLQEVTALLQTQASLVRKEGQGTHRWALRYRDLALLCVGVATGRRRSGLLNLRVEDVDFKRGEIRFDWEKGKAGRVMPVIGWAMDVVKGYVNKARPVLRYSRQSPWLFVSERGGRYQKDGFRKLMGLIHEATVAANPDLQELADKHLTPHSLRVSFAKLLFHGGCNIRTINELMQHENLTSTAYYTPLKVDELRRVFRVAHPRA